MINVRELAQISRNIASRDGAETPSKFTFDIMDDATYERMLLPSAPPPRPSTSQFQLPTPKLPWEAPALFTEVPSNADDSSGFLDDLSLVGRDEVATPDEIMQYRNALDSIYSLVMPLVKKLQGNPEKDMIRWPNRAAKMAELESKINSIYFPAPPKRAVIPVEDRIKELEDEQATAKSIRDLVDGAEVSVSIG